MAFFPFFLFYQRGEKPGSQAHTHSVLSSCMSIAIIYQIYLHWSRAKINHPPPINLNKSALAKSNHSWILAVIDRLPIQLNLSQMEDGVEGGHCLKEGGRGRRGEKREMAEEET